MNDRDIFEAVAEGVDRAISRMIHGATDMPSADFWDTLKYSIQSAFENVAREREDE